VADPLDSSRDQHAGGEECSFIFQEDEKKEKGNQEKKKEGERRVPLPLRHSSMWADQGGKRGVKRTT